MCSFVHLTPQEFKRLCEEYGGCRLYIPSNLCSDHDLVEKLDRSLANKLCEEYGGTNIDVPLHKKIEVQKSIASRMHSEGKNYNTIAKVLNKSFRTVRRWVQEAKG